jgi:hypothetical protein
VIGGKGDKINPPICVADKSEIPQGMPYGTKSEAQISNVQNKN